jgi:hypothetical protein
MNPDPAIVGIDLQDANEKLIFTKLFNLLLFEGNLHHFSNIKSQKKSRKTVGI